MNIIEKALSKKGTFATIQYSRAVKVKKNSPMITKVTRARNVRIGAQYDALKAVQLAKGVNSTQEAHELNTGLKGFKWDVYPTVLHSVKTNKQYIRVETNNNTLFETTYIMDGKVVNKADVEQYMLASEKSKGDMPVVLNIKLDTISYIH